jgi:hypothetical protein
MRPRSKPCPARASARSPTPASAAATCWPSGSARATRSRPSPSARRRPSRWRAARPSIPTTWACPSCARPSPPTPRAARPVGVERIAVTSSGVTALMLAMQMLAGRRRRGRGGGAGVAQPDGAAAILGAHASRACAAPRGRRLAAGPGCAARRRDARHAVLLVNAPNNPTGWTLTRRAAGHAGALPRTGTWIVADEVYERLYFGGAAAAARRASWTSPSPTTGWWSCTASARAS